MRETRERERREGRESNEGKQEVREITGSERKSGEWWREFLDLSARIRDGRKGN